MAKKRKQKKNVYKIIQTDENYYSYTDRLSGFHETIEYLDDGAFSSVYVHPTHHDIAVKVYSINESPNSDPYIKYLKWIENNSTNPYVPKIYDVRVFDGPTEYDGEGHYAVIHMERLYGKDMSHTAWRRYRDLQQLIFDFEVEAFDDTRYGSWLRERTKTIKDKDLKKVLRQVASYSETYGAFIDLHRNNVMWRKNQPVIIDPIAA